MNSLSLQGLTKILLHYRLVQHGHVKVRLHPRLASLGEAKAPRRGDS